LPKLSSISNLLSKPPLAFAPLLLLPYSLSSQALSAQTLSIMPSSAKTTTAAAPKTISMVLRGLVWRWFYCIVTIQYHRKIQLKNRQKSC
jgi:hypothetical protein